MSRHSQGTVDPLDFAPVLQRQTEPGTKLTFVVPTEVSGQSGTLSALTLKNQLRDARGLLMERGLSESEAEAFLTPVTELLEDSSYWRLQSRSLIVYLADDFFAPMRLPIELPANMTVGESFNVLPAAPVLASDRNIYILALARNGVRLFDSSRNVIEELPLKNIPASFDEVVDELPERVVDVRASAAGAHGVPSFQGPDGDADRALLEKFIHAVGQAVGARLGTARSQLLVLAAVAEYLPLFTAHCPYPAIFDGVVPGNPEHTLPDELRSAAWKLVREHERSREESEYDRANSLAHAGTGAFDLAEIANAAELGRVDTLFLPRDTWSIPSGEPRTLANRALLATLENGGVLRTLGDVETHGIATFRY